MINKIFIRGTIILGLFFGSWFLLQQVNWIRIFDIDIENKNIQRIEKELGKLMISQFKLENEIIENELVTKTVDSIVTKICEANHIDKESLQVYIFNNSEVNAFALPDRQLVIYTGLIDKTEKPEALSGVIAHELAHIEKNHVMKTLVRELGLGVLFSIITGGDSISGDIIQMVSSSAFSREMEKEADLWGVKYLLKAKIDTAPFTDFIGLFEENDVQALKWVSSHPISKERKEYILNFIENKDVTFEEVISPNTWEALKSEILYQL
ncbi:MAG: M48 family metallopeptidase [Capnocytophaga sp.]|nr:M48 family metallopeptidase [Capnocytophaga sp.]